MKTMLITAGVFLALVVATLVIVYAIPYDRPPHGCYVEQAAELKNQCLKEWKEHKNAESR